MKLVVVYASLSHLLQCSGASGAAFTAGSSVVHQRRPHSSNRFSRLALVTAVAVGNDNESRGITPSASITTRCSRGLLRGVDPSVDMFYADEIDMTKEGLAWLDEPGLLWEAATKDAEELNVTVEEYVVKLEANVTKFGDSGIIYDREGLLVELNKALSRKGALTLLLGGKNVGKSTILMSLAKFNNLDIQSSKALVLYVDARFSPSNLEAGIANEIAQLAAQEILKTPQTVDWVELLKGGIEFGAESAANYTLSQVAFVESDNEKKTYLRKALKGIADALFYQTDSAKVSRSLLDKFIEIAARRSKFPVLVIDEANVVLGRKATSGNQTIDLLTNFASYTKQHLRMNVILASSEYSYPYRLEQEGLDLDNLKAVIFAGEIPPKDMWRLLVSAKYAGNGTVMIGMGPHLAELCISAYGGHFWNVRRAIEALSSQKGDVEISSYLPLLRANINRCLLTKRRSRPLLEAMSKYGFAPVQSYDPVAQLISKENVGGVINKEAFCASFSRAKWKETTLEDALIPSSQCVRLKIAKVLLISPAGFVSTLFKWIKKAVGIGKI